jgi:putative zinc finger protein
MNCTSIDLNAYFLGELDPRERSLIESHAGGCQSCCDELDRLRVTQAALLTLPQEEIPQRIAFVSDKVFEPRWWQSIWRSGPAMAFASSALLAAAILVHAATRPATVVTPAATIDNARIERQIQDEVARRVDAAVIKAVAQSETRQAAQTTEMLAAAEKRLEREREENVAAMQQVARYYSQQMNRLMVASNDFAASQPRGAQ